MQSNIFVDNTLIKGALQPGYNPSLLPFPKSALAKKCQKIAAVGALAFEIFARTGVKFHDRDLDRDYNLTEEADAFSMLVKNRDFGVHQTAPQSIAAAMIISEIALQAEKFRNTFSYVKAKRSSFNEMLEVIDKIASAIGILADYQVFDIDVETAANGIQQCLDQDDKLFGANRKCKKIMLQSQAEKLSVVRGEGPVETIEFIKDAKPIDIVRAVKRAGVFDFSVGTVPTNDVQFMKKLSKHLEEQRLVIAKLR